MQLQICVTISLVSGPVSPHLDLPHFEDQQSRLLAKVGRKAILGYQKIVTSIPFVLPEQKRHLFAELCNEHLLRRFSISFTVAGKLGEGAWGA